MQSSAGPDLPHTHSRAMHWVAIAAAVAAVLGLTAVIQPPDAKAGTTGATGRHADGPDPTKARYPVDCGGRTEQAVDVLGQGAADFDADGRTETVALVRCRSGIGTPPSGIFVLAHPRQEGGRPLVVETLLPPAEGMNANAFTVRERSVSATLLGYSSEEVPRCCPDKQRKVKWEWRDGKFALVPAPVAKSV